MHKLLDMLLNQIILLTTSAYAVCRLIFLIILIQILENNIGDDGLQNISQALTTNTNPQYLNLGSMSINVRVFTCSHPIFLANRFTDSGFSQLADALSTNTTLTTLYCLEVDNRTEKAVGSLVSLIQNNKKIQVLDCGNI